MIILIRWLILTVAVMVASCLLEGVQITSFFSALFTAAVLGFLNTFFRPILLVLTLPINVLSLGLFTFIINALLIKMASGVVPGFSVQGFWTAVFAALIISIVSTLLEALHRGIDGRRKSSAGPDGTEGYIDLEKKGDDRWE
ncbi:MAG: phage holin family protein [Syntrophales bacterium]|jgi:putative membrane protein|nr:phage holin family protein [Syntrophales bacterium]MCK9527351.1 phage holin family protein [Syntrophales bacterium]MDX9921179.1 phage holin family protein [Syntrophales bacterium]